MGRTSSQMRTFRATVAPTFSSVSSTVIVAAGPKPPITPKSSDLMIRCFTLTQGLFWVPAPLSLDRSANQGIDQDCEHDGGDCDVRPVALQNEADEGEGHTHNWGCDQ